MNLSDRDLRIAPEGEKSPAVIKIQALENKPGITGFLFEFLAAEWR